MVCSNYVIYSPARTGSTLIRNNLQQITPGVIHTHFSDFIPPSRDWVCIFSRRQDVFAEVLSHAVMEVTQEPNNYTNKEIKPFVIDPDRFDGLYQAHRQFYNKVNTALYQQIIDIWFDPLMQDPYYLFSTLGHSGCHDRITDYSLVDRSPYNYYHLVTNVLQLKKIARAVNNGITNQHYK